MSGYGRWCETHDKYDVGVNPHVSTSDCVWSDCVLASPEERTEFLKAARAALEGRAVSIVSTT